ncbi:sulfite exporter TauE/SafE family protein [Qipengyuania aquimaris]|uniref:sulfite exporter TauE/SafE family protein n=1 Tax=Qipengyuania aquimaris TaxID=255984 RepID=UPI001CD672E7|nr:sulfite exporter TauE/SafE family protein [Qipengyuania aquimaris]MCA0903332.1 sulfite exporter TauE/SafE family protein [Qipengyuania aquimaris]
MDLFTAYEPWQLIAALAAAFGSAYVRGLTGFGMAILLVPVLALALTPIDAVLLANFLSIFIGMSEIVRLVRGAERSAWIIAGIVLLTAPLGFIALSLTTPSVARLIVALIAFSAFLAVLLPRRPAAQPGMVATGGVGVVSGLMTGYAGMPGPPVVPYYVGRDIPRETAKASMMLIFTIAPFAGLATGAVLEVLDWQLALLALGLFPAVLIGNKLGDRASGRMPDPVWRTFVGVVLAGAALAAFLRLL